ncbi:hypothetical protein X793_02630 [Dehalococcoides mccartyi CG4]|nr:hypothetical protein X793_02630 [Dehalococcoides mccartyi CG4]
MQPATGENPTTLHPQGKALKICQMPYGIKNFS